MDGSEWIACSERVPRTSDPVLAVADGKVYAMQFYRGTEDDPSEWACAQGDGWQIPTYVTHWMPMPLPPADR